MIDPARVAPNVLDVLKTHVSSTLEGMRASRLSFWGHWAQLAEMFSPRRYKWFVQTNPAMRGGMINQAILDETGLLAARTLAAGMMSGLTSPTKPWFQFGLRGLKEVPFGPLKTWLADCARRMQLVMASSNFYQSLAQFYWDNVIFGSSSLIIYEDDESIIHCYGPCLGEFFFGLNDKLVVDSLYREFTLTVDQAVKKFKLANVSEPTRNAWKQGGAARQREIVIAHAIEPNDDLYDYEGDKPSGYAVPKKFKYREVYWEKSSSGRSSGGKVEAVLKLTGFNDKPFVGARWDVQSNDPYGRSPGMDALAATRQSNVQQLRKAEAIDKMVRPPLNAPVTMKNEPASILPGAINYVADVTNAGMKPVYQVDPRLSEMMDDIKEVQSRINSVFFVDLFMMISQLDTVRTATEIDARREEKLIQLGPVIERFENEVLDPIITRIFNIMWRRGLFAPPPAELQGHTIDIQYISMLAEAQRAASTSALERLSQIAGNLAAAVPEVLDVIDWDQMIESYANLLNVKPDVIRSPEDLANYRKQKQQQAAAAQAADPKAQMAAVNGAQVLSQTQVGGGKNALDMMLNGAPAQ